MLIGTVLSAAVEKFRVKPIVPARHRRNGPK
jgi:hypothetical protein